MADRLLPVRPNLAQLKRQAKDLLRDIRAGVPAAIADLAKHHPRKVLPESARLADAQLVLARLYNVPSWPRLVLACDLVHAIWEDDVETVRTLVRKHPQIIHENALVRESNWGKPMSYAANLGRDEIIQMLHEMGATDHPFALGRAALQSKVETAKLLHKLAGSPLPLHDSLCGPAYTLSSSGTQVLLELGAQVDEKNGGSVVPVVLGTDSRKPDEKHKILELYVKHGLKLPHTPTMALHRGRIDLLEDHLRRDPRVLHRRFTFDEIYPPEVGCRGEERATFGSPLHGTTLLHMCVDYDEFEIAEWLIQKGADVNAKATLDARGFGGHTPLFATVVSQPNFWMNFQDRPQVAPFAELLLSRGADPNARASLRKKLNSGYGEDREDEYFDVTPIGWGRRFTEKSVRGMKFPAKLFVNEAAIRLIREKGGRE